ncbi:MAG: hypothetical protein L0Y70_27045, partial [Gemmataceae bacterium]|nr:hypothetical protein [Gemmataceae bacterium]
MLPNLGLAVNQVRFYLKNCLLPRRFDRFTISGKDDVDAVGRSRVILLKRIQKLQHRRGRFIGRGQTHSKPKSLSAESWISILQVLYRTEANVSSLSFEESGKYPTTTFERLSNHEQKLQQCGFPSRILADQNRERPQSDSHRLAEGSKVGNVDSFNHGVPRYSTGITRNDSIPRSS